MTIKIGKIRAGVECGQRWYRFNSWFPRRPHPTKTRVVKSQLNGRTYRARVWRRRFAGFRRFNDGFAIGPLMFWKERTRPKTFGGIREDGWPFVGDR